MMAALRARRVLAALLLLACCAGRASDSPIALEQRRGAEQTFLTFPEWFLVHSPAEYARFVGGHPAHAFPFLGHVGQLWGSYGSVTREQLRGHYPANIGYHVMINVIAISTTVEYSLRSLYENTLGRLSWAVSSGRLTEEDKYGAAVAQDYVDFIRREPWYLYDFSAKLKGLWRTTPAWGPDMLRKWERRYALTTEYLVKAAYGKLIEVATRSAYDEAALTTQVVVRHAPSDLAGIDGVKRLRVLADDYAVLELPRYFAFRIAATQLAARGASMADIAGNDGDILLTMITDDRTDPSQAGGRILFQQPILTEPGRKRTALVLKVAGLSRFLLAAPSQGIQVEHVYDY